jgi:hypothetical protein
MEKPQSDWEKPFPERFLSCADAFARLEHWLMVCGMGGNANFTQLKSEFLRHGAETFNGMQREADNATTR